MIIVVAIDKILIVILFFKGTSLISKRVIKEDPRKEKVFIFNKSLYSSDQPANNTDRFS